VRVRDDRIVSIVLDAEAVIVDLETATYYTLTGAGALAWAMLDRGHGTSGVAAALARRYDVEEARAVEDVERLVDQLLEAGIVEPERHAREPAPLDVVVPDTPGYRTPVLQVDPSALTLPGEG
jgi:coenzyme PQQ synthesis protein D (PqqD)